MAASFNQSTFRFRNDDGNETTATWRAIQNFSSAIPVDTSFRVRFEIQNNTASAGNNKVWQLQYNKNNAGWVNVTASSVVVRSTASPNLADAANLTNQLTLGTGTFIGLTGFDEVNGQAGGNSMDVPASGHAETEFCVQLRSVDLIAGDTVWLRATDAGTALTGYTSGNATINVLKAVQGDMPKQISAFTLTAAASVASPPISAVFTKTLSSVTLQSTMFRERLANFGNTLSPISLTGHSSKPITAILVSGTIWADIWTVGVWADIWALRPNIQRLTLDSVASRPTGAGFTKVLNGVTLTAASNNEIRASFSKAVGAFTGIGFGDLPFGVSGLGDSAYSYAQLRIGAAITETLVAISLNAISAPTLSSSAEATIPLAALTLSASGNLPNEGEVDLTLGRITVQTGNLADYSFNGVVPVWISSGEANVVPCYRTPLANNVVPIRIGGQPGVPIRIVPQGPNIVPVAEVSN